MKSLSLGGVVLLAQLASWPALAGSCTEPTPFTDIPDGSTATRDQMLSAQRAMKAYDIAVRNYSDCLHDAGDTSNKVNAAVDRLHQLAERFNTELHAFKQRNGAT